jgi:hypothetical protein
MLSMFDSFFSANGGVVLGASAEVGLGLDATTADADAFLDTSLGMVPKSEAKNPSGTVLVLGWCFISHFLTLSNLSSVVVFDGGLASHCKTSYCPILLFLF